MTCGAETLNFRMTQILTGHGCFAEYLHKIRAKDTTECAKCGDVCDSATHTPTFASQRERLRELIGQDLCLPKILAALLDGENKRSAITEFYDSVIGIKEAQERNRETSDPRRRARRQRRRGSRIQHGGDPGRGEYADSPR